MLPGVSVVFSVLVSSSSGLQSYVTMFGLLLKMGFLVDVLARPFQYVVGCLRFSVRAGLHVFVSTVIPSADIASAAALSIGSDLLQKDMYGVCEALQS